MYSSSSHDFVSTLRSTIGELDHYSKSVIKDMAKGYSTLGTSINHAQIELGKMAYAAKGDPLKALVKGLLTTDKSILHSIKGMREFEREMKRSQIAAQALGAALAIRTLDLEKIGSMAMKSGNQIKTGLVSSFNSLKDILSISGGHMKGLKETVVAFNRSAFDSIRLSEAMGRSGVFNPSLWEKVHKSTNLSKQDFAALYREHMIFNKGLAMTSNSFTDLSKIFTAKFGGGIDQMTKQMQQFQRTQEQLPGFAKTLKDINSIVESGKEPPGMKSMLMMLQEIGGNQAADQLALIATKSNDATSNLLNLENALAENQRALDDIALNTGLNAQEALVKIADSLTFVTEKLDGFINSGSKIPVLVATFLPLTMVAGNLAGAVGALSKGMGALGAKPMTPKGKIGLAVAGTALAAWGVSKLMNPKENEEKERKEKERNEYKKEQRELKDRLAKLKSERKDLLKEYKEASEKQESLVNNRPASAGGNYDLFKRLVGAKADVQTITKFTDEWESSSRGVAEALKAVGAIGAGITEATMETAEATQETYSQYSNLYKQALQYYESEKSSLDVATQISRQAQIATLHSKERLALSKAIKATISSITMEHDASADLMQRQRNLMQEEANYVEKMSMGMAPSFAMRKRVWEVTVAERKELEKAALALQKNIMLGKLNSEFTNSNNEKVKKSFRDLGVSQQNLYGLSQGDRDAFLRAGEEIKSSESLADEEKARALQELSEKYSAILEKKTGILKIGQEELDQTMKIREGYLDVINEMTTGSDLVSRLLPNMERGAMSILDIGRQMKGADFGGAMRIGFASSKDLGAYSTSASAAKYTQSGMEGGLNPPAISMYRSWLGIAQAQHGSTQPGWLKGVDISKSNFGEYGIGNNGRTTTTYPAGAMRTAGFLPMSNPMTPLIPPTPSPGPLSFNSSEGFDSGDSTALEKIALATQATKILLERSLSKRTNSSRGLSLPIAHAFKGGMLGSFYKGSEVDMSSGGKIPGTPIPGRDNLFANLSSGKNAVVGSGEMFIPQSKIRGGDLDVLRSINSFYDGGGSNDEILNKSLPYATKSNYSVKLGPGFIVRKQSVDSPGVEEMLNDHISGKKRLSSYELGGGVETSIPSSPARRIIPLKRTPPVVASPLPESLSTSKQVFGVGKGVAKGVGNVATSTLGAAGSYLASDIAYEGAKGTYHGLTTDSKIIEEETERNWADFRLAMGNRKKVEEAHESLANTNHFFKKNNPELDLRVLNSRFIQLDKALTEEDNRERKFERQMEPLVDDPSKLASEKAFGLDLWHSIKEGVIRPVGAVTHNVQHVVAESVSKKREGVKALGYVGMMKETALQMIKNPLNPMASFMENPEAVQKAIDEMKVTRQKEEIIAKRDARRKAARVIFDDYMERPENSLALRAYKAKMGNIPTDKDKVKEYKAKVKEYKDIFEARFLRSYIDSNYPSADISQKRKILESIQKGSAASGLDPKYGIDDKFFEEKGWFFITGEKFDGLFDAKIQELGNSELNHMETAYRTVELYSKNKGMSESLSGLSEKQIQEKAGSPGFKDRILFEHLSKKYVGEGKNSINIRYNQIRSGESKDPSDKEFYDYIRSENFTNSITPLLVNKKRIVSTTKAREAQEKRFKPYKDAVMKKLDLVEENTKNNRNTKVEPAYQEIIKKQVELKFPNPPFNQDEQSRLTTALAIRGNEGYMRKKKDFDEQYYRVRSGEAKNYHLIEAFGGDEKYKRELEDYVKKQYPYPIFTKDDQQGLIDRAYKFGVGTNIGEKPDIVSRMPSDMVSREEWRRKQIAISPHQERGVVPDDDFLRRLDPDTNFYRDNGELVIVSREGPSVKDDRLQGRRRSRGNFSHNIDMNRERQMRARRGRLVTDKEFYGYNDGGMINNYPSYDTSNSFINMSAKSFSDSGPFQPSMPSIGGSDDQRSSYTNPSKASLYLTGGLNITRLYLGGQMIAQNTRSDNSDFLKKMEMQVSGL